MVVYFCLELLQVCPAVTDLHLSDSEEESLRHKQKRARLMVMGAVLSASVFILPFKVAARDGRGAGAALGLLGFVVVLFAPWVAFRVRHISGEVRMGSLSLAWKIAIAAAAGNIAQGYAFEHLHAGVAATFMQMNVLFVALLGVLWLKEGLRTGVLWGVLLAATGVAVTQVPAFAGHFAWSAGVFWAIGAAFGFSFIDVLSRQGGSSADPLLTNVMRSFLAAVLLSFVPGAVQQLLQMGATEVAACAAAALLGPGVARQLLLRAARDLPAAESALLQQSRPILALPLGSVVFGHWPTPWEWLGCAFILLGILAPFVVRGRRSLVGRSP